MVNVIEYLNNLNKKSIWAFTKQKVDFEQAIKVANLFDNIPNRDNENIEKYFTQHHKSFGIETDRHRTLVIPQFFGLITKTPFYERGGQYNKEKTTAIYDKFKTLNPKDIKGFNTLKTEQLLKIKIHAIIDTANNNQDYNLLPIIFIYKVLKELQKQYNIDEIKIEYLYLFIMTCKKYDDWQDAVEMIATEPSINEYSDLLHDMEDFSRVLTLIKQNIKLFNFSDRKISINPIFDNYFYNKLVLKFDLDELSEILDRDVDYSYFLYNIQGFDINLIDEPEICETEISKEIGNKEIIQVEETYEELDDNYLSKVDRIKGSNINPDVGKNAFKEAPTFGEGVAISKKYKRNPLLGKISIQNAYYACEGNHEHLTFESATTNMNFMEAHHLVPVKDQGIIWQKYQINVDCVENIVSLCPTCHRAFHNGTDNVKKRMIHNLYHHVLPRYRSIGFEISIKEIEKLYGIE